jgi:hypothetical protein
MCAVMCCSCFILLLNCHLPVFYLFSISFSFVLLIWRYPNTSVSRLISFIPSFFLFFFINTQCTMQV